MIHHSHQKSRIEYRASSIENPVIYVPIRTLIYVPIRHPLHLSRILYKSPLFMQNKPNFLRSQMNLNPHSTMAYENISDWTPGENKPNSNPIKPNLRKAQMNVNLTLTKDYRKKDDFSVRINKPNFFKGPK